MLHHRTAGAAPEKIKRGVVGDTEQPAFRIGDDVDTRQGSKSFNAS